MKRREDEKKDFSSYWMILSKREDNWKLKEDALDLALEEAMDLSYDRLHDDCCFTNTLVRRMY
jgi:hypothetical protein